MHSAGDDPAGCLARVHPLYPLFANSENYSNSVWNFHINEQQYGADRATATLRHHFHNALRALNSYSHYVGETHKIKVWVWDFLFVWIFVFLKDVNKQQQVKLSICAELPVLALPLASYSSSSSKQYLLIRCQQTSNTVNFTTELWLGQRHLLLLAEREKAREWHTRGWKSPAAFKGLHGQSSASMSSQHPPLSHQCSECPPSL